jgi:hypothetical protein
MRTLCVFLCIMLVASGYTQPKITRFENLPTFSEDAKYNMALTQQFGVIGNNYLGETQIGKAPAETVSSFNSHYPIDGYKRTICGNLNSYFIKTEDNVDDDDVHFIMRPDYPSKQLMDSHNLFIRDLNTSNLKRFPTLAPFLTTIANPDIKSINGIEAYNETIASLNKLIFTLNKGTDSRLLRNLKHEIYGEIDLPNHQFITKFTENVPKQELDCTCIYGAWVNDRLAVPFGSYHDNLEIHPTEQAWWSYQKSPIETVYYLGAFGDASGIFYKRDNYDTEDGDYTFFGTWLKCPQTETHAIPFEIKNKMPTLVFNTEKKVSNGGVTPQPNELPTQVLMFKNDTLLRVNNNSAMAIRFDKVGIARIVGQDTFYRGFVVFQTQFGDGGCSGTVISKVTVTKPGFFIRPPIDVFSQPTTVKVTLKNIQCLSVDDGDDVEDILGYAGVVAFSTKTGVAKIPIMPKDKESFLLFSRLDNSSLSIRKNQVIDINESRTFELDDDAFVVINSDLDEDDGNDDKNINDLDDGDDHLQDINEKGKAVKKDVFYVKNLTGTGKTIETKHTFTSGGTKVVLTFLVERSGGTPIVVKDNSPLGTGVGTSTGTTTTTGTPATTGTGKETGKKNQKIIKDKKKREN